MADSTVVRRGVKRRCKQINGSINTHNKRTVHVDTTTNQINESGCQLLAGNIEEIFRKIRMLETRMTSFQNYCSMSFPSQERD